MEYVDGEGTADARAAIESHLANCAACQSLVADQQRLAGTMHEWRVAPAPDSLQPPAPPVTRPWWSPSRTLTAGLAAAAIVLVAVTVKQRPTPLSAPAARSMEIALQDEAAPSTTARSTLSAKAVPEALESVSQQRGRGPMVIRTARLHIVTSDFSVARESVESIVAAAAGFVDTLTVTGDTTKARAVRGTLRVPAQRIADVLTSLRRLGTVLEDTQGTQDVTDQVVDLDARTANARATEQRLTELLRNRTGRLSDVLEIEREVARVRLEIERLDAEKTNLSRRVSYATIDLAIAEERKESIDGPVSLTTRLRLAALDGIESAFESAAGVVLFLLRAGPTLLLWGALAGLTWLLVRRLRDQGSRIRGSAIRD